MNNSLISRTCRVWFALCFGVSLMLSLVGCEKDSFEQIDIDIATLGNNATKPIDIERLESEIRHFCGDCHAPPPPASIPKAGWASEVDTMFKIYEQSGRNDLSVPLKGEVIEYYRRLAPESISLPTPVEPEVNPPVEFEQTKLSLVPAIYPESPEAPPGIANLTWYDAEEHELLKESLMLGCDMKSGVVFELKFEQQNLIFGRHVTLNNPCHSTLSDLDRDGVGEFLIADLGSFLPEDHRKGRVLWLRPSDDDSFSVEILFENVGRVTDIQTGDFNGDDKTDLIVAEFGWRDTGNVWMLTQSGIEAGIPQFSKQRIDDRHGVIHVPTNDINKDGHMDFISVVSQEHETVELFLNRGDGSFRRKSIFSANSPVWGSTGIDITDFDADGDVDILYTNGDIFDTFYIVPYHAAHFLKNKGDGKWESKVIGNLPGIHRAVAGDLDNDGDQDVVCCSLISRPLEGVSTNDLDAIIWLEQTSEGEFIPHSLEKGNCNHSTVVVADFDEDGDLDIATAQFEDTAIYPRSDVSIWWNNSIIPQ